MKNILLALLVLFSLANCSDYLDEQNKSTVLQGDYYTTPLGYDGLVNSAYASLREVYDVPWVFLAGTDEFVEGRNLQPDGLTRYKNLSSNDTDVSNFYTTTYRAIQRCNSAVSYNSKVVLNTSYNVATLKIRLGEVKFLRAYYYFLLVQQFGGVSIVTDEITHPEVSFARNTEEEVYTFIVKELEEALTLLPATTSDFGRAAIPAVKHFLAKVHLTRGYTSFATADDFSLAASLADEVIGGKPLSVSFEDLFWPGKEKNAEILFSIQFDKSSLKDATADGSNQNYWFGPYMGGEGAKNGYPYRSYNLMPSAYVYKNFTEFDARWEGTFMNVYYARYYDFYDKKADRPTLTINYYFPQTWEADTAAWRAADATRRKTTKIVPFDSTKWVVNSGSGSDNGTPAIRKFDDPTSQFSANGSSTRDIYLARLGETYLIAAEAYFKKDDKVTAAARLNEVRRRGAKSGKAAQMVIADTDVTIDFILDERTRELLGEYGRWFDLKRTGTLVSRTLKHNRDIYKISKTDPFVGGDGKLKLLRPIPQVALDLNQDDSFTQNPGY